MTTNEISVVFTGVRHLALGMPSKMAEVNSSGMPQYFGPSATSPDNWKFCVSFLIAFVAVCFLYTLPLRIAEKRRSLHSDGIIILTTTLGWTGIGWMIALVWACVGESAGERPLIRPSWCDFLQDDGDISDAQMPQRPQTTE